MEHLMANHISRDTIIKYHDRAEFLEAKHFLSKVKISLKNFVLTNSNVVFP